MPIYFPPPPPFTGGNQPLSPRELNPSIEAVPVNDPPFTHLGRIAAMAAAVLACQPGPPNAFIGGRQPLAPRTLPAAVLAQQVDNPPFASGCLSLPEYMEIRQAWEPGNPAIQRNLSRLIQSVDNPPARTGVAVASILQSWQASIPLPQLRTLLVQGGAAAAVDNPPGINAARLAQIVSSWQVPSAPAQLRRLLVQGGAAVAADNPPGLDVATMAALIQSWQTPAPAIVPRRLLNPSVLAVRVDNPPFGRRDAIAVIRSWIAADPPIVRRVRLVTSGAAIPLPLIIASDLAFADGVSLAGFGDGVTLGGYAGETIASSSDGVASSGIGDNVDGSGGRA